MKKALAIPGRPGVRVIAKQFGVDPGTVQRDQPPFRKPRKRRVARKVGGGAACAVALFR